MITPFLNGVSVKGWRRGKRMRFKVHLHRAHRDALPPDTATEKRQKGKAPAFRRGHDFGKI